MIKTYLVSDTHFNHYNIIKYCNRPFVSIKEMNETIIKNWNESVSTEDTVFFLGDFAFNNHDYFLKQLNGNIYFIKGNHDKGFRPINMWKTYKLSYKEFSFILIHDKINLGYKKDRRKNEWIICGHTHDKGRFIDKENRIINVSIELINYKPIDLEEIYKQIISL